LQYFTPQRHIHEINIYDEIDIRHDHRIGVNGELEELARELVQLGRFRDRDIGESTTVEDGRELEHGYGDGGEIIAESVRNATAEAGLSRKSSLGLKGVPPFSGTRGKSVSGSSRISGCETEATARTRVDSDIREKGK
jgi:hypothetical protein